MSQQIQRECNLRVAAQSIVEVTDRKVAETGACGIVIQVYPDGDVRIHLHGHGQLVLNQDQFLHLPTDAEIH